MTARVGDHKTGYVDRFEVSKSKAGQALEVTIVPAGVSRSDESAAHPVIGQDNAVIAESLDNDGLTIVEPLADVDLNEPGDVEIPVAPEVTQLSVVLPPEIMVAGLAEKEMIEGFDAVACTETVAVAVTEPESFVAVRV